MTKQDEQIAELQGRKVGAMEKSELAVLDACIGLHGCKGLDDMETVWESLDEKLGTIARPVDKIVIILQALMVEGLTEEVYKKAAKMFLKVKG